MIEKYSQQESEVKENLKTLSDKLYLKLNLANSRENSERPKIEKMIMEEDGIALYLHCIISCAM